MNHERHLLLGNVINLHNNNKIAGRKRLQKTIHLLQLFGVSLGYTFKLFFYGPYSEDLSYDLSVLSDLELAKEEEKAFDSGGLIYEYSVQTMLAEDQGSSKTKKIIEILEQEETWCLELASTYLHLLNFFEEQERALELLKRKKRAIYTETKFSKARELISKLENLSA